MTIQLNAEQERVVGQAIRAGLIRGRDDVAEIGIASIRQRLKTHDAVRRAQSAEEWSRELAAWSEGHGTAAPLLPEAAIDRESTQPAVTTRNGVPLLPVRPGGPGATSELVRQLQEELD